MTENAKSVAALTDFIRRYVLGDPKFRSKHTRSEILAALDALSEAARHRQELGDDACRVVSENAEVIQQLEVLSPAALRCYGRVAEALPPSNPREPGDPSVNLDTLMAILHVALTDAQAIPLPPNSSELAAVVARVSDLEAALRLAKELADDDLLPDVGSEFERWLALITDKDALSVWMDERERVEAAFVRAGVSLPDKPQQENDHEASEAASSGGERR